MKKLRERFNRHSGLVVYVVIAVTAIVLVGLIQKRSDDADEHLQQQVVRIDHKFAQQGRTIVATGRQAISSGCQFDNQRARQIRKILFDSKRSVRKLYEEGQISRDVLIRSNRQTNEAIRSITVRDCTEAASVLKYGKNAPR